MPVIEAKEILDQLLAAHRTLSRVSAITGISRAGLLKIKRGDTSNVQPKTLGKLVKGLNP